MVKFKPVPKAKVRRARLLVSKVDPWSVLKMAFLLSVALGIVTVVAAIVLWTVLDLTGIFDQVDSLLGTLAGSEGGGFELKKVASLGQVASFATIIAVINVVLLTALSMLSGRAVQHCRDPRRRHRRDPHGRLDSRTFPRNSAGKCLDLRSGRDVLYSHISAR